MTLQNPQQAASKRGEFFREAGLYLGWTSLLVLGMSWIVPAQPCHQGTSLMKWVERLNSPQSRQEAVQAIQAIGSNALPWLDQELRVKDSPLKLKLFQMAKQQSFIQIHFTTAAHRQDLAVQACAVLGPVARPLIPALAEALGQGNGRAVKVLENFGPEAISALSCALTNAPGCGPPYATALALGRLGADARPALTNLVWELDHYPVGYPRAASARAISKISLDLMTGEKASNAPDIAYAKAALLRGLADTNWMIRGCAADSLGDFGDDAKEAKPALEKLLDDPNPQVRAAAHRALTAIQPGETLLVPP